ncbi:MAG: DUF1292 domain-containing protein [Candidatus Metalachnospira sp.]|nr:DUF1292 domain-containing protein [Candidatus Metalachnospira sp.]
MSEHNCGCGCDHEHDEDCLNEELETMTLTLDDDTELECVILGIFDVEGIEGKEYIALLPQNDETVLIYEYKELENEEVELLSIEDDAEFEKVSAEFDTIFNDDDDEE